VERSANIIELKITYLTPVKTDFVDIRNQDFL